MGHLAEYLYILPGPLPAGTYSAFITMGVFPDPNPLTFAAALVWRTDGGADQTLYSATLTSGLMDAGHYVEEYVTFDGGLPAVPARCGDLLVLQLTQTSDAGTVIEASPSLHIP